MTDAAGSGAVHELQVVRLDGGPRARPDGPATTGRCRWLASGCRPGRGREGRGSRRYERQSCLRGGTNGHGHRDLLAVTQALGGVEHEDRIAFGPCECPGHRGTALSRAPRCLGGRVIHGFRKPNRQVLGPADARGAGYWSEPNNRGRRSSPDRGRFGRHRAAVGILDAGSERNREGGTSRQRVIRDEFVGWPSRGGAGCHPDATSDRRICHQSNRSRLDGPAERDEDVAGRERRTSRDRRRRDRRRHGLAGHERRSDLMIERTSGGVKRSGLDRHGVDGAKGPRDTWRDRESRRRGVPLE